jgi:hypothetical protein
LDTAKEERPLQRDIEIAKAMLLYDEPLEKIVKYAGLTKAQVEEIKNKAGQDAHLSFL